MSQHFLIVGLGNPGPEYFHTRHNIGFRVLDALMGGPEFFRSGRYADVAELKHRGRVLHLAKPTTYMNLSGKAVRYWLQEHKLTPTNLLVLTDDIALPYGTLRLRAKGSDGGHNGLKDIQAQLNTQEYARLRMGVGAEFAQGKQVDYVLGEFGAEERTHLPAVLKAAGNAVQDWAFHGMAHASTHWNKMVLPTAAPGGTPPTP